MILPAANNLRHHLCVVTSRDWAVRGTLSLLGAVILLAASGNPQQAQPSGSEAQTARSMGQVVSVDTAARRITIRTDAGAQSIISFGDATRFLRVAPGARDLSQAIEIKVSDLAVGDRVLARGKGGTESGRFDASSVIVMSRADLEKKHEAERAEWRKRGVGGVITALDPANREITINAHTPAGVRPMVIGLAPGAVLRRYAPDSVKFSEARPSRFEQLEVGDQVRALGETDEDRTRLTAVELVSGSFRTIPGIVSAVDANGGLLQLTDLATHRRIDVRVTPDSLVRRLPALTAQMLAMRISAARTPAGSVPPEVLARRGPRDLESAIEALPPESLEDIKPGEALVISCTKSEDPSKVTAITLLAGVEPLLRPSPRGGRAFDAGSWNLDLNMDVGMP